MSESFNIEDYLGKPFEYGGDGIHGYDCWTLSREILRTRGVLLPKWGSIVDLNLRNDRIVRIRDSNFIRLNGPKPYSIVLFKLKPPFVTHMGVVLSNCVNFIHILKKKQVVVERIDNIIWKPRIEGFYEYIQSNRNTGK